MKKRSFLTSIQPSGVLRWSTLCILAGGAASLSSCDRGVRTVGNEVDMQMAETQTKIEKLDDQKGTLQRGEVKHNFEIPGLGFYHAGAYDFFEHPHGFLQNGRWFINGEWKDQPEIEPLEASRPAVNALEKVDAALAKVQQENPESAPASAAAPATAGGGGQGFGMGNALMMYWLLSGNRGLFSPGAGFTRASGQAGNWQKGVEDQRSAVGRHAATSPSYQRMVAQSRASGSSVNPGQSVRGGFGSRATGTSFGG
jgi:hypothetical protein